jgi:2-polyprenyl-6-hydroxyphenyl methylase/3-demethylubiquinone-9 3-methyltransferase
MTRDRIARTYDGQAGSAVDQRLVRRRIHWMCANVTGREVADIGCGAGVAAVLLGREGANVVGVDRDSAVLREAARRLEDEDDSVKGRVRFTPADAADLPFADEAFDSVLLGNVLDEQLDRARVITEIARVLKPDGRLVATVPYGLVPKSDYEAINVRALLDLLVPGFAIDELELIDRYLAVAATKAPGELSADLVARALELAERRIHDIDIQLATIDRPRAGDGAGMRPAAGASSAAQRVAAAEEKTKEIQRRWKAQRDEMERRVQERDLRIASLEVEKRDLSALGQSATSRIRAAETELEKALREAEDAKADRHRFELEATNQARHVVELESIEADLRQRLEDLEVEVHGARRREAAVIAERDALRMVLERTRAEIERARASVLDAREAAARAESRADRFERELGRVRTSDAERA